MTLTSFNNLSAEESSTLLMTCCGCEKWVELLLKEFPFKNEAGLIQAAENAWYNLCTAADWLEAFSHHPKIGDTKRISEKFSSTKHLTGDEQAGVNDASANLLGELANANFEYQNKFGFIFIVSAAGRSASEMLHLLLDRLFNSREEELNIAMGEQHKITILRLKKLIDEGRWSSILPSQLTTHVLDTSLGKPGENITIRLKKVVNAGWQTIAQGVSNSDGRIMDLLPFNKKLLPGSYKLVFEIANYFFRTDRKGFYPEVEIQFMVFDEGHYHVPLLITQLPASPLQYYYLYNYIFIK